MISLFALTGRGLEHLGAEEMAGLPGLRLGEVSYRRITASYEGDPAALLALRTVDDIFLALADWDGLVPQRGALARIRQLSADLPLQNALDLLEPFFIQSFQNLTAQPSNFETIDNDPSSRRGDLRSPQAGERGGAPSFSVTANFVGKRNYSSDEIKEAVSAGIQSALPWRYAAENESQLNIRVFIEHDLAQVGLRLSASPLHARAYKQTNIPGSLKPTVAAAMLRLAGLRPEARLLDPFCGAGTIPIEAALMGACSLAGDHSPSALSAAAANARSAGLSMRLCRWDGLRLPLPSHALDFIVTNLPWGRQVAVDAGLQEFYRAACAEMERLLVPGGRAVLLTSLPHLVRFERLSPLTTLEIGLFGQSPSILVCQA